MFTKDLSSDKLEEIVKALDGLVAVDTADAPEKGESSLHDKIFKEDDIKKALDALADKGILKKSEIVLLKVEDDSLIDNDAVTDYLEVSRFRLKSFKQSLQTNLEENDEPIASLKVIDPENSKVKFRAWVDCSQIDDVDDVDEDWEVLGAIIRAGMFVQHYDGDSDDNPYPGYRLCTKAYCRSFGFRLSKAVRRDLKVKTNVELSLRRNGAKRDEDIKLEAQTKDENGFAISW